MARRKKEKLPGLMRLLAQIYGNEMAIIVEVSLGHLKLNWTHECTLEYGSWFAQALNELVPDELIPETGAIRLEITKEYLRKIKKPLDSGRET